ncbi:FIG00644009: hypothetical protein [Klebsiella pneumoniae IS22]|nr:FIG00644009: hypothetical protein [Klebsiella pneumoniae IS22]
MRDISSTSRRKRSYCRNIIFDMLKGGRKSAHNISKDRIG